MTMDAAQNRFLLMEFDGGSLVFAEATRAHPGSTVDIISEPTEIDGEPGYLGVFMVRGLGEAAMTRVEKELTKRYEEPKTLRRDFVQQLWMGRVRMKAAQQTGAAAQVFNSAAQHWGIPWVRYEDGLLMVRARINDPGDAERVAREVREKMAANGVEVQVEIQEVAPQDFGIWRDLVEASLGIAP